MSADTFETVIGEDADAVTRARRQVTAAMRDVPAPVLEDVRLVVTELVTNGLLHGRRPVVVRAVRLPDGVRVEVQDSGTEMPVLPRQSTEAMTGRGLALVARLAARWGASLQPPGKVVWAEVSASDKPYRDAVPEFDADTDLDALLAAFGEAEYEPEQTYTVELGSVPTDLLLSAKAHIDNLQREFTLAAAQDAAQPGGADGRVPDELAQLIATVVHGFSAARNAIKRQALAAAERGDLEVRLQLTLPASAADAGEQYLEALDVADRYARNARLLTLETPPVHQVFRRYYVQTLVDQLRSAADGTPAEPAPTFTQRLGEALTRLAPMEAQAERLQVLQKITAELTGAGSVDDVVGTVVRNAAAELGAYNALVYLLGDSGHLRVAAAEGTVNTEGLRRFGHIPVTTDTPGGAALLTGDTIVCRDRAELLRRFPLLRDAPLREYSLLVAPLVVGEHQLGVLSVTFRGQARIEEHAQRTFITALADLTAQALERAMASRSAARADERLAFLAEASLVLSSTSEDRPVLEAVAELVVPRMADWCSIELLRDGRLDNVAVTHTDPDKVRWAVQLRDRYPTDTTASTGAPNVARTGVSELYTEIPEEMLTAAARDDEHLRLLRELGMTSALVVPLTGRSGTLGAITLISAESGRRYDRSDVAFAEDLARRAALAVENAAAYREQSGRVATLTPVAGAAQHAIYSPPPARVGPVALAARYTSAAVDALCRRRPLRVLEAARSCAPRRR
jgi:GAF domain-containing protein/anti-sigma regulatory factor (Ser/Thr protein kinase)